MVKETLMATWKLSPMAQILHETATAVMTIGMTRMMFGELVIVSPNGQRKMTTTMMTITKKNC